MNFVSIKNLHTHATFSEVKWLHWHIADTAGRVFKPGCLSRLSHNLLTELHNFMLKQFEITDKNKKKKKKKDKEGSEQFMSLCRSMVVFKKKNNSALLCKIFIDSDTWQTHFTSVYIDGLWKQLLNCSQRSARFSREGKKIMWKT